MAFSLPAYLARVGLSGTNLAADHASLAAVMAAQTKTIAFENIDVVLGRTVTMETGTQSACQRHSPSHPICISRMAGSSGFVPLTSPEQVTSSSIKCPVVRTLVLVLPSCKLSS